MSGERKQSTPIVYVSGLGRRGRQLRARELAAAAEDRAVNAPGSDYLVDEAIRLGQQTQEIDRNSGIWGAR